MIVTSNLNDVSVRRHQRRRLLLTANSGYEGWIAVCGWYFFVSAHHYPLPPDVVLVCLNFLRYTFSCFYFYSFSSFHTHTQRERERDREGDTCLFCCYQPSCAASHQSWFGLLFHIFSNFTPPQIDLQLAGLKALKNAVSVASDEQRTQAIRTVARVTARLWAGFQYSLRRDALSWSYHILCRRWINIFLSSNISYTRDGVDGFGQIL